MSQVPPLDGWIPVHVHFGAGSPLVEWCHLGPRRLSEPFFSQSVAECLQRPFNHVFRQRTPIDVLDAWRAVRPGLPPAGLIFHMSRCGSTLAARLLATLPQTVVLSEAPPIDHVLRAHELVPGGIADEDRVTWLRGMVSALAQPRDGRETHCVIKFDSWNTRHLPLIQRAFPGVPWVFLYRDPVEVLVSQLRRSAINMMPGLVEPGLVQPLAPSFTGEDRAAYCAHVLADICRIAFDAVREGSGTLLNYDQLPEAVWRSLVPAFGLVASETDIARMGETAQFDAKEPSFFFESDAEPKQREATDVMRRAVDQWLRPLYDELEALRLARV